VKRTRDDKRIAPHEPQPTPLPEPAPTPIPEAPPRRKRRALGRIARWVALLVFLSAISTVVTVVIGVRTPTFQRRALPLVEALVEQQTGEAATINRLDLSLWPPAVELEGVRLWHVPTGDTIVHADRIRVPVVLRAGGPRLGKLTLEHPEIDVHVDKDGLREFRARARAGHKLHRLPWGALEVTGGGVHVHLKDGGLFEITDLDVTPVNGPVSDLSATLHVHLRDLDDRTPFAWTDVALGPTAIDAPAFRLDSQKIRLQGSAHVPLDGPLDVKLQADSDLEGFDVLLGEPRAVHGLLDADIAITGQGDAVQARANVLVNHFSLELPGKTVPIIHYRFGSVAAAVVATKDGADVERVRVDTGDGIIEAWGHVAKDLTLHDAHVTATRLGLEHALKSMDAAPTPWTDLDGDLEATLSGTLNPLRLEGPFELVVHDWNVGDRPISDPEVTHILEVPHAWARGVLVLKKRSLAIKAPVVQFPRSRGTTDILIGFGPRGPLDLRFDLPEADLADGRPLGGANLQGKGHLQGRIWGPFNGLQLLGTGDVTGFEVTGIHYADHLVATVGSPHMRTLVLTDAHAQVGRTKYHGDYSMSFKSPMSIDTDITFTSGRAEDLIQRFVDVRGLTGDMTGTLSLHGPLYDLDGQADVKLKNVDVYGEKFPTGEGHGYMDDGIFTLDDLRLLRHDGKAGLLMRGSVKRQYKLNMELIGDGFRLDRLDHLKPYDLPLSGRAAAVVRIDNTLFSPAPHGQITVTDVRYTGEAVGDSSVKLTTDDGVMRFQGKLVGGTVALVGNIGLWDTQPYSVFASFADFPAGMLYPRGASGKPVTGKLTGKLELDGNLGDHPSPVDLTADVAQLELDWRTHTLKNASPWHFAEHGRDFTMTGFSLEGGITMLQLTHAARDETGLDLQGGGRIDLDLLRLFVPDLVRSDGYADLSLTAAGKGGKVQTHVKAQVSASLIRHTSFPGTFEDVHGTVEATDSGYDIRGMTAGLGGGQVIGGGHIDAKDWRPERWNLTAQARDAQVQWIDALPPAIGDADLRFDGPVGSLLLSGDVTIRSMEFVDRINWEDWVVDYRTWSMVDATPSDQAPWFSMDVAIKAGDTIRLKNNVADGTASADLRVIGDTTRPGLTGRVVFNDGVVFLQDREFQVERGLVSYRDPWTWDPDLDIELVTDITSRNTRYRVHYLVRGPFSNWQTETRSEPSLAQADINALLWFGVTADDLEGMGELPQAVAQGVADMILTDLFITRGSGVREELGTFVDRVEIATGVDTRGEYSPDPRIVLEKNLDPLDATARVEINTIQWDDWQAQADFRLSDKWSLALWCARRQRERVLSIGGAYGIDLRARWELE